MVYYNSQFKKVKEIKSAIYNINNREVELLYKPEGAYIILTVEEVFKLAELLKKNKDDEEKPVMFVK